MFFNFLASFIIGQFFNTMLCSMQVASQATILNLLPCLDVEVEYLLVLCHTVHGCRAVMQCCACLSPAVKRWASDVMAHHAYVAAQYGVFLFFAGCVILNTLFAYICLPETKGVPVEKIEEAWDG